jgi:hypothetical protein
MQLVYPSIGPCQQPYNLILPNFYQIPALNALDALIVLKDFLEILMQSDILEQSIQIKV